MDAAQVPAGSIVVGVDGSSAAEAALTWAADQASLEQRPLTIVHAVENMALPSAGAVVASTGPDCTRVVHQARDAARALLTAATKQAVDEHPRLTVNGLLRYADPRTTLLDLGETAAMLVVGSRGRGPVSRLLLGSVSVSLSKHATCPVVIHRASARAVRGSGVLVGVDGGEHSLPAIDFAYRMASWRNASLTVLHCYWESTPLAPGLATQDRASAQELVSESVAGMHETYPEVEVRIRLRRGFADQHLIAASSEHELVVVGHHPIPVLNDIVYGSVAPQVVEHAHGAVAVVPSALRATGTRSR